MAILDPKNRFMTRACHRSKRDHSHSPFAKVRMGKTRCLGRGCKNLNAARVVGFKVFPRICFRRALFCPARQFGSKIGPQGCVSITCLCSSSAAMRSSFGPARKGLKLGVSHAFPPRSTRTTRWCFIHD